MAIALALLVFLVVCVVCFTMFLTYDVRNDGGDRAEILRVFVVGTVIALLIGASHWVHMVW